MGVSHPPRPPEIRRFAFDFETRKVSLGEHDNFHRYPPGRGSQRRLSRLRGASFDVSGFHFQAGSH